MEEKDFKNRSDENSKKIDWEAPKLFCLDKGKTEGGNSQSQAEDMYASTFTFAS